MRTTCDRATEEIVISGVGMLRPILLALLLAGLSTYTEGTGAVPLAHSRMLGVHSAMEGGALTPSEHTSSVVALGATGSFNAFAWNDQVQPTAGQEPDWSLYDDPINTLTSAGIEPIFIIWGSPSWANFTRMGIDSACTVDGFCQQMRYVPPVGSPEFDLWLDAYEDFVGKVITRYKGVIRHWELWNEPNLTNFWLPVPSVEGYCLWYERIAGRILETDPEAQIALGSLAVLDTPFLDHIAGRVFLREVYETCQIFPSIVSVHSHPTANFPPMLSPVDNPPHSNNTFRDIETIHKVMLDHDQHDAALVMTGFGYQVTEETINTPKLTEAMQEIFLRQGLTIWRDHWPFVSRMIWFWDRDRLKPGTDEESSNNGFGLVRLDPAGELRPSGLAFQDLAADMPIQTEHRASIEFSDTQDHDGWSYRDTNGTDLAYQVGAGAWWGLEGGGLFPRLNATGGHPWHDVGVIRRWTASIAGSVTLFGTVANDQTVCVPGVADGIVASVSIADRTLWSRTIANGEQAAFDLRTPVEVVPGTTIDFRVESGTALDAACDSFRFDPTVVVNQLGSGDEAALALRRYTFARPDDFRVGSNPDLWTFWTLGAVGAQVGTVARKNWPTLGFAQPEPPFGGDDRVLRMTTPTLDPAVENAGLYLLSPEQEVKVLARYRVRAFVRNAFKVGVMAVIFYDANDQQIGAEAVSLQQDGWQYNEASLTFGVSAGAVSARVRFALRSAEAAQDVETVVFERLPDLP